jgi:predicted HAD superfamily Cof-like phosphohydrolase
MGMPLDVLMFLNACDQKESPENAALYKSLMEEEFKEFIDAHWDRDEVEMLDGCMDLIWVTLGFCIAKGYDIGGAWDEVVKTNMAKVDPVTRKVRRREDGKILKSTRYFRPEIKSILERE